MAYPRGQCFASRLSHLHALDALDTILYEQPLNERMRALLRLEHLFDKTDHYCLGETEWDARACLECLFELAEVAGRAELRTELTKELDRHAATLTPLMQRPGVDTEVLAEILEDLRALAARLSTGAGQAGGVLKDHEMLASLRQRSSIPGGACGFDLPGFHRWLQTPLPERRRHVEAWFADFDAVRSASLTLMRLIRQSAVATQERAEGGFYQEESNLERPLQLVRIRLPRAADYFPEVSGGKHRFTIRFMRQTDFAARPSQLEQDIAFDLTRCVI